MPIPSTPIQINYSIKTLKTPAEIETVRLLWRKWQKYPNCDIDYYLLICSVRENVLRPHVIVAYDGEIPCGLLVARLERGHIAPNFGYFAPFRIPVRKLVVLYQGVMGNAGESLISLFVDTLDKSLREHEADVLEYEHLDNDSPLLRAILNQVPWLWRDSQPEWNIRWLLTIPTKPGALLQQKLKSKHRSWIKKKAVELEQAFPGRVRFRTFPSTGSIDQLCAELESVASRTYQRGLGTGFFSNAEHHRRFDLFNQTGAFRAWLLDIDGIPKAFCYGLVYGETFHFSETGYDQAMRDCEIGTLLFIHMVDELAKEGIPTFDFGIGDAQYKRRFGDRAIQEGTLRAYRRSLRGAAARVLVSSAAITSSIARSIVSRLGVIDRIKTGWRKRLARQSPSGQSTPAPAVPPPENKQPSI